MKSIIVSLLLAYSLAAGQAPALLPAQTRTPTIGPEDSITIQAVGLEDLSKVWRVSASGDLSLPWAGRIHVAGMPIEALEDELRARLVKVLLDPKVTAYISEYRSQPVTVTGAVLQPGTYQIDQARTLYEMVVRAGGPKDAGVKITLRRDMALGAIPSAAARSEENGRFSVVEYDLADVLRGYGEAASLAVRPYDVVAVSSIKEQKFVYISGEVVRPGMIELVTKDRIPLSVVLAMSGGLMQKSAKAGKTTILRPNAKENRNDVTYVDLNKILEGKAEDIELKPGDMVVVPSSQLKAYMQALSMTAATAGIYMIGRF